MKKTILISLFSFIVFSVAAQSPIDKGSVQLNAGLGLSGWGVPVYVGLDFGVSSAVTAGLELSYRSYHQNWHNYYYNHTIMGVSGNVNYHFDEVLQLKDPWNLYAGLNLGFYYWNSPNSYDGDGASGLGIGAQIGGRYYFNDKFAINLEFGGGNAFAGGKIGVSVKL
ncbi:MAG: outer membrane beta-barrel protein [Bacteroidota bacterium]